MTVHATDVPDERPASASGRDGPLVVVADDSPDMRGLLQDILHDMGCRVVTAGSGASALRAMADQRPDLLITDLLMPGMSGFSLRAAMLRRPELASVPVIVLSAYWRRPSETLDAMEVLPKPLNIERLTDAVRRLTRGTDARHEA